MITTSFSGAIRPGRPEDAARIAEIYNDFVLHDTATFEEEPFSTEAMAARMEAIIAGGFPYYVYEEAGTVLGYACAHPWKERASYRYTAETTIYLTPEAAGHGVATALMHKVIADCRAIGLKALIACITETNATSIAFHRKLGFKKVSHFEKVGFKLGQWLDVVDLELLLYANPKEYIEAEILPRYESFDAGHGPDHAQAVIERALTLAEHYDVNPDIIYAAAAYHDTGLAFGRENHHLDSGRIIREDRRLREWFSEEQIETIAQAAEDHRASAKAEPRSIYGRIIAEADRLIDPMTVIRRAIQFGLANYPELSREGQFARTVQHLQEKYAEGGYLKLYIPESDNAAALAELRTIIADRPGLRRIFDNLYDALGK